MYALDDIVDALRNPRKLLRELNLLYYRRLRYHDHNPNGIDIFDEDWDNLILLDACRNDAFAERSTLTGTTESRQSRGAHSREFVRANFAGRTLHDTVVVTANFWYEKLSENVHLHSIVPVTGEEYDEGYDGRATPPEAVSEAAREAAERYPNKRLIVHYMQPHRPFLGPVGEALDVPEPLTDKILSGEYEVSDDRLWEAYLENVDIVLEDVEKLLPELDGKTVVSADHGELMGERQWPIPIRAWGHVHGIYMDELTKVPWHIFQSGDRRSIVSEEPESTSVSTLESDEVDERLRQLGYL